VSLLRFRAPTYLLPNTGTAETTSFNMNHTFVAFKIIDGNGMVYSSVPANSENVYCCKVAKAGSVLEGSFAGCLGHLPPCVHGHYSLALLVMQRHGCQLRVAALYDSTQLKK
jgi:hypothetical protein